MSSAPQQIVICGYSDQLGERVARLIRRSAASPVVVRKGSARSVRLTPEATTITFHGADLMAFNRLAESPAGLAGEIAYVILMRDPRDMLIERDAHGRFVRGHDHSIHIADKGIATYSDPGIFYLQKFIDKAMKRGGRVVALRQEDFELRPDLAEAALAGVTGLTFTRRFAHLMGHDPEWAAGRGRMGDEHPRIDDAEAARLVRQFRLAPDLFPLLERWGYVRPGQHGWFDPVRAQGGAGADDTPGTLVGFYTVGTRYEAEAQRLTASVQALGLPLHLEQIPAAPDWLTAVRRKPGILRDLRERLRGPLLYVDVDAVLHRDPWPYLRGFHRDVAVAGHRNEQIISGTILLNDTPGTLRLIDRWIAAQDADPAAWDQHALQTAALAPDADYDVDLLPPEMCCVFDRRYNPPIDPVIEHLQASRENNAASDEALLIEQLERRHTRIAEIEAARTSPPAVPAPAGPSFAELPPEDRRRATQGLSETLSSDVGRWADPRNLKANWSSRAELVGQLLTGSDTVLDIGCGMMDLERALPAGARYVPADIVARDDRTLLCDLNAGLLPDHPADVVTMLGVLEYCHDPLAVLKAIAARWRRLVLTYNPRDLDAGRDRRLHGWFNDLTSADVVATADAAGFQLQAIVPHQERERIYVFERAA